VVELETEHRKMQSNSNERLLWENRKAMYTRTAWILYGGREDFYHGSKRVAGRAEAAAVEQ
jgi:hypothetical protein